MDKKLLNSFIANVIYLLINIIIFSIIVNKCLLIDNVDFSGFRESVFELIFYNFTILIVIVFTISKFREDLNENLLYILKGMLNGSLYTVGLLLISLIFTFVQVWEKILG